MPRKVKIAPLTRKWLTNEIGNDWNEDAFDNELRALLAVAKAVHIWFMDEDDDRRESTAAGPRMPVDMYAGMLRAHGRLERISKGSK